MIPTITEVQRQQFAEKGYFVLENVFTTQEMDMLAEAIEAFQRRHEEALAAKGGTEGISRAGEITFTAFLAEQDETIRAFCLRPEFVAITTQLLSPDTDLYWNQSVFKGPDGSSQFPWHQDDGYTPVDPSPYLTLWLALNDATEENGCISVLPGSHKRGLVPHRPSPIGLICHELDDPDQGVRVPVKAGSMAVFSSLTMHKSGVNRTAGTRKAYVIQYSHAGLKNAKTGEVMPDKIPVARNGEPAK
ncbi:MAG TPA: phytanoyl-CoA dioxygenase family protein [Chthonomonadaceae bacterium]|nr:phytanoyl-CoA dioxygenase family protein [Chthonomonadaceae bacterium]